LKGKSAMPPRVLKNYINGRWVNSNTSNFGNVLNPAAGEVIATVPYGTADDVDSAVAAAQKAYPAWRGTPPLSRARYLFDLKTVLEEAFEDIARILTTEQGKTIDESRGEVRRMIENVEHATSITTLMTGYCFEDVTGGVDCTLFRQPMGVFAAIAPYNFPAMVPFWFLPYAIVTGNTFVLKPSEKVPLTQEKIFRIMDEIGLPDGVVNLVNGSVQVVDAILDHPDIIGVSFVGSTPTARYIYEKCGAAGKRVQALGGAKNVVAVMPDADIDASVPSLITSFLGCAGQRCLSGAILAAVGDTADELIGKFKAACEKLLLGPGLNPQTQMGPLISREHRDRVLDYIDKGIAQGADLILDGRISEGQGHPDGFFLGPTIFDHVQPDMVLATDEIFGPVVSIVRADNLDDVLDLINTRGFANAACIYTKDAAAIRRFRYQAKPSMIGVNIGIAAPMSYFPFGGSGHSMFGDIKGHGREIISFYTDAKVTLERQF
jgi:malonate-semialdehyde dehydrogenase (acetylating)/methylmalonate-semialdehyde dehydrogenase